MEVALQVSGVSVGYEGGPVISNVNLAIPRGETFGLMGLNGAGKTTLIKAILGLRDRIEGAISINGLGNTAKAAKAHVAYLPERFDPPSFLTGREFLQFSMRLYSQGYEENAVRAAAERLALSPEVLGKRVNTYSKGMRQKLGLLATLLTNCSLMILDEPMSGLDPMARALVKEALCDSRRAGRTIFLSSHILADMNEICDHVAVLHGGGIVFDGTPQAMLTSADDGNLERAFLRLIQKVERSAE
ncbi:MAG: ABC transporter ATP-binding protein [Alphaproteobacteria bacterium]|nr:ABC transporter ATP-binding protein [Alphaproteobacteria bacterium]